MFLKKTLLLALGMSIGYGTTHAQTRRNKKNCETCNDKITAKAGQFKKGEMFFYWGYNRAVFSKSDIRFSGLDSDFILQGVRAKDRPTPFNFNDYILAPSIPQFVMNVGWFFKDNWCLTLGTDHMKYVMVTDQETPISGYIADNGKTSTFAGHYFGERMKLSTEFLTYEHTNGLNYVDAGLEHYHTLWSAKKGPLKFTVVPGMSLALMYPRSDVSLFGIQGSNVFHVAGWGTALHLGFRVNLLKNIFVMWNNKGGFIALPDVLCQINSYDAQQHFFFYQSAVSLGYNWRF